MQGFSFWVFIAWLLFLAINFSSSGNWLAALGCLAIIAGAICNKIAVTSNGGKMPVIDDKDPFIARRFQGSSMHKAADEHTRFRFLVDRFTVRLKNRTLHASIGDLAIFAGLYVAAGASIAHAI